MFQGAREKQKIKSEEVQIQVVERKKAIEVEEKEIQRKEKELTATVKSPAEAESYKMETIAQGKRYRAICIVRYKSLIGNRCNIPPTYIRDTSSTKLY